MSETVSAVASEVIRDVHTYAWDHWVPKVLTTLVFIIRDDEILMIQKKTGLGAGKVNGPGGKVDRGEEWLECARREVLEELHIKVGTLKWMAELKFLMSDYPDILCQVFFTDQFEGEPVETPEAAPMWVKIQQIPWDQMWTDDQYWLPRALLGERVLGLFSFQEDQMCSMKIFNHPQQDLQEFPIPVAHILFW